MQEAQFAVHWKVGLHFYQSLGILENCLECGDDLIFFLLRFFPHFPDLCQQSIDAMLDLCEDVNTMIRMQVPFFFISLLFSLNCIALIFAGDQSHSFLFRCFSLKIALLSAGDQRHAQPLPRLPDQDSSQDCRCSHPTPPGELFRLVD